MRYSKKGLTEGGCQSKSTDAAKTPVLSRRSLLIGGLVAAGGGAVGAVLKWCDGSHKNNYSPFEPPVVANSPDNNFSSLRIERDRRACNDYFKALESFRSVFENHLRAKLVAVYAKTLEDLFLVVSRNKPFVTFQESSKQSLKVTANGFFCGNLEQHVQIPDSAGLKPSAGFFPDHRALVISENFDRTNFLHQLTAVHETLHASDSVNIGLKSLLTGNYLKPIQLELRAYGLMIECINAYTRGILKKAVSAKQDLNVIIRNLAKIFRFPQEYNDVSKSLMGTLLTLVNLMPAYFENYKEGEFSEGFVRAVYVNERVVDPNIGVFDKTTNTIHSLPEGSLQNLYATHLRKFTLK